MRQSNKIIMKKSFSVSEVRLLLFVFFLSILIKLPAQTIEGQSGILSLDLPDKSGPKLEILYPTILPGAAYNTFADVMKVKVKALDRYGVMSFTINGQTIAPHHGIYETDLSLAPGLNEITIIAED